MPFVVAGAILKTFGVIVLIILVVGVMIGLLFGRK